MIREHLFQKKAPSDPCFRWRGGEVSRVEGLSDGVFAFALTLLVVSLSVPNNFYEVWLTIRDFPAFAMSFAVLIMCWYSHYIFFRRYGLEDFFTMFINTIILFLVLFYVFPLRFMATLIWRLMIGDNIGELFQIPPDTPIAALPGNQTFWLVVFYDIGIVGIFGLFYILKLHAMRLKHVLELDEIEVYLTKTSMLTDSIWIAFGLASIAISFWSPPMGGLIFCLMGPVQGTVGSVCGTRAEKMFKEKFGFMPGTTSHEVAAETGPNEISSENLGEPDHSVSTDRPDSDSPDNHADED